MLPVAGLLARWRAGLLALLIGLLAAPVSAHKASDAYLQIESGATGLDVRWDIALRDLEIAIGIDADGDGRLTWGEVKQAWSGIERLAGPQLAIAGCPLRTQGEPRLERRSDGAYAVLQLTGQCPVGADLAISYSLFRDIDPTHRGIVKVRRADGSVGVAVLDPRDAAPTRLAGPGGSATLAASAGSSPAAGTSAAATPGDARSGDARQASSGTAGTGFVAEGVRHLLTGYDHLLFLLCLLLPSVARRTPQGWVPVARLSEAVWPVLGIVTAFTVAHTLTLLLAATGHVSLPGSLIEPAIALTIVLAALDNLWRIFPFRRVVVTFGFGLIHGFGFAGVLAELDLPPASFAWALLQFNLGLEAGQIAVVIVVMTVLFALRRTAAYPQVVIRGGSVVAIALGLVWLVERTADVTLLGF